MQVTVAPAEDGDFEFAFAVKQQALGPYVTARWGCWDDAVQREFHRQRWAGRPWSIISYAGQQIGTVSVAWLPTHVQFGEFYLLPKFQKQGIGTEVLRAFLQQADNAGLPVHLEYIKGNPVGSLYKRHGFAVVTEDSNHYFLARAPGGAAGSRSHSA